MGQLLLTLSPILACPLCRSDTGRRVREGIFNNEFGDTLLAMVLPFLVVAAVVGLIYGGPPRGSRSDANPRDDGTGESRDSRRGHDA